MKFLFIIQGEGKGHLTQALTLEEMLTRHGHQVVEVLVGKSNTSTLPGFFNRSINAPVKRFLSPHFSSSSDERTMDLRKSVSNNLTHLPEFYRSMCYINHRIKNTGAEVVINFYELLTGLTYALFRPSVPCICVGHQYLFLHPDFNFPERSAIKLSLLKIYTRMTSFRAHKRIALSLRKMDGDGNQKLAVVPPLLRDELISVAPEQGDYIHGYMTNGGFADSIEGFHQLYPDVQLHFFWNNLEADEETKIDDTLSYHLVDDTKFLNLMAGCKGYASTAGFESICEAMYLGKPILMVSEHIGHDCNAYEAMQAGAGIACDNYDLDKLIEFSNSYTPNREFVYWVRSSEHSILTEIEDLMNHHSYAETSDFSNCMPA